MNLLISPHNDDAVLFASFTILREKPRVVTVFDSYVQPSRGYKNCDYMTRRCEDVIALEVLDRGVSFLGFRDDRPDWEGIKRAFEEILDDSSPEAVYAPCPESGGHEHHNVIGELARAVFGPIVTLYMTYTKAGKSIGKPVPYEPEWVGKKLRALACYESQIALPNCVEHFLRPQFEYYQP